MSRSREKRRTPTRDAGGVHTIPASNRANAELNYLLAPTLWILAWGAVWGFGIPLRFESARDFNPVVAVPAFLAVAGVWFAGRAVVETLRLRRDGESWLECREVRLGGRLHGIVRTTRDLVPTGDYTLTIRCIETIAVHVPQRSGATRTEHQDVLRWHAVATVGRDAVRSTLGIPVDVAIPHDALATRGHSEIATGIGVRWVFEVCAPMPGLDYYAVFLLRVSTADG